MNFQQKPTESILNVLKKKELLHLSDSLEYYAFPQLFGSTTGPSGGIGGQSMSTFTVHAWVYSGFYEVPPFTIYECNGVVKVREGEYKGSWF